MNANLVIDILGTEWKIIRQTLAENESFEDCDGYCDPSVKEIHIRQYTDEEVNRKDYAYDDNGYITRRVIRHEIIHAVMYESGMWRNAYGVDCWAMNEEMVDFFAIQGQKIHRAWKQAGCLD